MIQLRDYQHAATDAVLRDFESVQSTLAILPTGTGKTIVAAEVIRRLCPQGGAILLAHREELLHQAKGAIEAHTGLQCEFEQGNSHASEIFPADVLLASVQTMISGRNKDARRMHKFSPYNYNLIICDETHHAVAKSWASVLEYFKANTDLKILGITATPERADEEALGQMFESVAFDYSVLNAIRDGWLVPVQQQLIDIQSLDFSHIRTTAGDLNAGDLAAVMEQERNLYGICDVAVKAIGHEKAIHFAVTVKQAELSADIYNRYRPGIAVAVSGKTPKEDRRRIFRDFREGRNGLQLLVNVNVAGEGVDIPDASFLIGGRPTKSKLWYQQALGRIMRPLTGTVDNLNAPNGAIPSVVRREAIKNSLKPVATVMDFVGNAGRHKLVHAIDVLGGKISDKVRELAERELRKTGVPVQIDELVEEAQRKEDEERIRELAAKRARLTAQATYTTRYIDPFDCFDILAPPQRQWDRSKHLSEKQRALLQKQGIDADRLTYAEGKTVLNELFNRWDKNLCSLKQCALLKRFGYDPKGVTREQAGAIITNLKSNGWKRPNVQPV